MYVDRKFEDGLDHTSTPGVSNLNLFAGDSKSRIKEDPTAPPKVHKIINKQANKGI